ncbi:MAG: ornithine carbamoyltransferase [Comamonadaceae bacterium]|nr:MAG: ornithine carbamoyltransferase [Comamonadaceae bacterium]
MPAHRTPCACAARSLQLSPARAANLLSRARLLQRAALDGSTPGLLRGKNLGLLCGPQPDEAQALFHRAAESLGAHLAVMRSGLSPASTAEEVRDTARMLGRLYDAVECQGLDAELVERIGRHAGVPVFDGAATDCHPAEPLAALVGGATPLRDNRCFVLQAVLLEVLG